MCIRDSGDEVPAHDVVFVGTGFDERIEMLSAIDWAGIDFGLYGWWPNLPPRHRLKKFWRRGVVPNNYAQKLYQRAKVNLNIYRESVEFNRKGPRITGAESLNPRAYELAALGAFHLSAPRAELCDLFGELVPTFRNPGELQELLRLFLGNDELRKRMARPLPGLVAGHAYDVRAAQLINLAMGRRDDALAATG